MDKTINLKSILHSYANSESYINDEEYSEELICDFAKEIIKQSIELAAENAKTDMLLKYDVWGEEYYREHIVSKQSILDTLNQIV